MKIIQFYFFSSLYNNYAKLSDNLFKFPIFYEESSKKVQLTKVSNHFIAE
jgi:hypothetical protein